MERFRPDLIFLENVPGIQKVSSKSGPFGRFLKLLRVLGYNYKYSVVRCQDYGVPQQRERLILVASLFGPISLPPATHGAGVGLEPLVTVRDAIGDLPPIAAGERHNTVSNHQACSLSELNLRRIRATPEGGGRLNWPPELVLACHKGKAARKDYTDVYGRMAWDRPASALTTRCISLSNGRFGHPSQDRAISIREAACLQTFDRSFIFEGSANSMAMQIGNAVPVALARAVGAHLKAHVAKHVARLNDMSETA